MRCKRSSQQIDTESATAAARTRPENAVFGLGALQGNAAARTNQFGEIVTHNQCGNGLGAATLWFEIRLGMREPITNTRSSKTTSARHEHEHKTGGVKIFVHFVRIMVELLG